MLAGTVDVQLLSDLHLEIERGSQPLYQYDFPASAENLALLGDIGWTRDERLFLWLEVQLSRFKRVFFVSGNHEPFITTLEESTGTIEAFAKRMTDARSADRSKGEFIFLNRTRYDLSSTLTILGCTLWSTLDPENIDLLVWGLTDFQRIDNFNPAAYSECHRADLAWLRQSIAHIRANEPERRVIVFTHHAPTIGGTANPKYIGGPTNSAFATELSMEEDLWAAPVAVWAFGHTHWNCDFERRGVRVVSNQRGYKGGGTGFDTAKIFRL